MTSSASPANESLVSDEEPVSSKKLLPHEFWWRDHQPWLAEKGYMLRPRYSPDWRPSWKDHQFSWFFEDGKFTIYPQVMDATRISDNALVSLKRFSRKVHPYETAIGLYLSSEPLASHPRNRCVKIYEIFDIPDTDGEAIMVMPLLREFWDPRMKSVGEAVEFFRQIFEASLISKSSYPTRALDLTFAQGLQFMHQCHVAHRDCQRPNIMMDASATFPNMYHPVADRRNKNWKGLAKYYTRTARPTKYYLIDFGLSRRYNPEDGEPRELPIRGGDRTVPEFQGDGYFQECNPFPTDIYYLGNMIKKDFLLKTKGLEFVQPLVNDMVQNEPSKRPTIDEVVTRFDSLVSPLSVWKLRSRLVELDEHELSRFERALRRFHHFSRTSAHILTLKNPIPRPHP